MAIDPIGLKVMAMELAAIMPPAPPREVVVMASGEMLSGDAMELARIYDRASHSQRAAFDALVAALKMA